MIKWEKKYRGAVREFEQFERYYHNILKLKRKVEDGAILTNKDQKTLEDLTHKAWKHKKLPEKVLDEALSTIKVGLSPRLAYAFNSVVDLYLYSKQRLE